jgi:peptidoglycan/LPS O-acetylase OafA/YrhL
VNGEIPRLVSMGGSPWLGDILHILMLLVTIAFAMLTYRYIEEPGRLWSRRYVLGSPVTQPAGKA